MKKPGGGCDVVGLTKKMFEKGEAFVNDKEIKKRFGNEASTIVKTVFESVHSLPIEQLQGVKLTKGTIRTFERKLNEIKSASQKGQLTSKFGSLFYTPSSIIQKSPHLMTLHDSLHRTNLNYQGRVDRHNRSYGRILGYAKRYMLELEYGEGIDGGLLKSKAMERKIQKASRLADKHEGLIEKLRVDANNDIPGSVRALDAAIQAENKFYLKKEGQVFNEILTAIETEVPKLHIEAAKEWFGDIKNDIPGKAVKFRNDLRKGRITRDQYHSMRKKILEPVLSKSIEKAPLRNLVEEYIDLMDDMYHVTKSGVKAYVDSIKEGLKNKYDNKEIDKIAKNIYDKILPDQVKGYYPHYRRVLSVDFFDNLMPRLQRVSDATAEGFTKDAQNVDKVISELKSYVTGHTKKRQIIDLGKGFDAQNEYSRNFLVTIKRYVDEVDRFNMIAHADKFTRQSLNATKEMFKNGEPIDGFAQGTVDMMIDLNARMKGGYGFENANAEAAMKTLLALEFTSKLGFNLRSGLRNSTQGLLNLVEFGPIMMMKSKEFYNNNETLSAEVRRMMDESGFLFADNMAPELVEGKISGKTFLSKVKINDKEQIEFIKPAMFSTLHGKAQKAAAFSGKFMGAVENFNRKTTFKVAFYKMYNQLNNSTFYRKQLADSGKTETQIKQEIKTRARNYALKKTTLLHFDYADISKASWITHPTGRLLGQFQHYGIKFFEYNMNLAKEGTDDILAGEVLGDRAQKAYKMGMVYMLAPVIASAVTGTDFTNIVEHDTKEKIMKLWTLFTGDDEEVRKAYYGKGVLTQLPFIGAPLVSDVISLGNVLGFMDMDDNSKAKLISGWEDYALASGDQKAYEILKTLNTSLSRIFYKTLPTFTEKGLGPALQYEAGLYKTPKSKKLQKRIFEGDALSKPLAPQALLSALDALDAHIDDATKEQIVKQIKQKKGKSVNPLTQKSMLEF